MDVRHVISREELDKKQNLPSPEEFLFLEFYWIEALIKYRIKELCENELEEGPPSAPELVKGMHPYFDYLIDYKLDVLERIAFSLTFIAQTVPYYLDYLYTKNKFIDQVFAEFGVCFEGDPLRVKTSWQTVFFLCFGNHKTEQFQLLHYLHPDHRLYREKQLLLPEEKTAPPFLTPLLLHEDLFKSWIYPSGLRNVADESFPAYEISSELNWQDLFLNEETAQGLEELRLWLSHGSDLMKHKKLKKYITPGVRVLFYGPSGTGKTLTASLLGKEFDLPVYRVDLSQMVSKWIGETEKNLARVFDIAEKQNWILFFDEADALFSKRATVSNSNDRRANQEVFYLLQRVENYDGTIIMASNLRDNIDDAFIRRFQLMIHFPTPDKTVREALWRNMLEDAFPLHPEVSLSQIAEEYELSGGSMKNVFRNLILKVYDRKKEEQIITEEDLLDAIMTEQSKSGIYTIQRRY